MVQFQLDWKDYISDKKEKRIVVKNDLKMWIEEWNFEGMNLKNLSS